MIVQFFKGRNIYLNLAVLICEERDIKENDNMTLY